MTDIYESMEEYNPNKKYRILIIFDNMTADILIKKKVNLTEIFSEVEN